jgi:hypothetical protein
MNQSPVVFREDFYALDIGLNIDLKSSGIYEWRIDGIGVYIGKALKLNSRIRAYPNNVRRMIAGLHWHGDATKDYRKIHKALRQAHDHGLLVTVSVLENCSRDRRLERELYWISRRREEAMNGGLPLLNAD